LTDLFEGADSERGTACRVADSPSLQRFLGYGLCGAAGSHDDFAKAATALRRLLASAP